MKQSIPHGRKLWMLVSRAVILLLVWGLFLHFAVRAAAVFVQYRQVSRALTQKDVEYRKMYQQYAEQLWEGERLERDREYQRRILKDTYYYFERDEQPLIIVDQ